MSRQDPDVIVVGGGPAGSTVATLVAHEGRRVLLLDREQFPRFRIGESLMPATYWTLQRLGVLDKLKGSLHPRKHSVQFFSHDGRSSSPFYFSEVDPHESSTTWQVDRAPFDHMLLDHARDSGVEVRERAIEESFRALQAKERQVLAWAERLKAQAAGLDTTRQQTSPRDDAAASQASHSLKHRLPLRHHGRLYQRLLIP